jgi:hypothetical protein
MKSKLILIITIGILFLSWTNAKAQTSSQNFKPSHLQAAENFLIAAGVDTKFPSLIESIVNAFSKQIPENNRATFGNIMRKFMNKYYTWDNLKPSLDKIYASEFTESELKELSDFYSSPIGKKYTGKSVELLQKNVQIGQQIVTDHQSEFEQMIKDAIAEKN